jgi:predicted dehydrogenase
MSDMPVTPTAPASLAIVGAGWRARHFVRLALLQPDRVQVAGLVVRNPAHAAAAANHWRLPVFGSLEDLAAAARPDLVVTAVPWPVTPEVTRRAVALVLPVLAETPPAPDLDGLRALWADVGASGLVQVAEQYPRMPTHASRLAVARGGRIGDVRSVQVSSTHGYHAVALMRAFLGVGFAPASVSARAFTAPLVDPLVRDAWTDDDRPKPATTVLATLDFGGHLGVYDFTDNQWHNQLRARRLVVRGSHGEISDESVVRLARERTIIRSPLVRRQTGYDLDLDGFDTDHITLGDDVLWRNPFPGLRLNDDEIAMSDLLLAAAAWATGRGPAPYPLAEGCQDHQLALAIEASAAAGGAPVTTTVEPWAVGP